MKYPCQHAATSVFVKPKSFTPSVVASGPPLHPPLLYIAPGKSAVSQPYDPMFANRPPPPLTKSAIFSALAVNMASVLDERLQLSGIHNTAGGLEVIVVLKKLLICESVI